MSITFEKLEGNMAELTITVPAEEFDKAMIEAYKKNKSKFSVPGFRKGKVPMNYIEKVYGEAVFYEEAANELINKFYYPLRYPCKVLCRRFTLKYREPP